MFISHASMLPIIQISDVSNVSVSVNVVKGENVT
jgi:hypothetical protein